MLKIPILFDHIYHDFKLPFGSTPLIISTKYNSFIVSSILLDQGLNPNYSDDRIISMCFK